MVSHFDYLLRGSRRFPTYYLSMAGTTDRARGGQRGLICERILGGVGDGGLTAQNNPLIPSPANPMYFPCIDSFGAIFRIIDA